MHIEPLPSRTLSPKQWDDLPPLVPKGVDKDEVVAELIDKWCNSRPVDSPFSSVYEHIQAGGFILEGVALVDANVSPPEPINLGELINTLRKTVNDRYKKKKIDLHRRMHVVLIRCRIDSCYFAHQSLTEHPLHTTFRLHNCKVTCYANFQQTQFGDDVGFTNSIFEKGVTFEKAKFSCRGDFSDTHFLEKAEFWQTEFGPEARFDRAFFANEVDFWLSDFGIEASFDHTRLSSKTRFVGIRFGPQGGLDGIVVASKHVPSGIFGIKRFVTQLKVNFSWETIRGIGGLQILTRASYAALILVPIIAGLWPSNLPFVQIQVPKLPIAWVLAYFAALFVLLGHFLYETIGPSLLKRISKELFVRERGDAYRQSHPEEQHDLLQRAFTSLSTVALALPEIRHPNFVRRNGAATWIPRDMDELDRFMDYETRRKTSDKDDKFYTDRRLPQYSPEELKLIIIDEGAKAEYDVAARKSLFAGLVCTCCYFTGGYLILWLLSNQAAAVLYASGWSGPWLPNWWWPYGGVIVTCLSLLGVIVWIFRWFTRTRR